MRLYIQKWGRRVGYDAVPPSEERLTQAVIQVDPWGRGCEENHRKCHRAVAHGHVHAAWLWPPVNSGASESWRLVTSIRAPAQPELPPWARLLSFAASCAVIWICRYLADHVSCCHHVKPCAATVRHQAAEGAGGHRRGSSLPRATPGEIVEARRAAGGNVLDSMGASSPTAAAAAAAAQRSEAEDAKAAAEKLAADAAAPGVREASPATPQQQPSEISLTLKGWAAANAVSCKTWQLTYDISGCVDEAQKADNSGTNA